MDSSLQNGEEILLDGGENTTLTFPAGMKVVFLVVRTEPLDNQNDFSRESTASDDETENDDTVQTDRGNHMKAQKRTYFSLRKLRNKDQGFMPILLCQTASSHGYSQCLSEKRLLLSFNIKRPTIA